MNDVLYKVVIRIYQETERWGQVLRNPDIKNERCTGFINHICHKTTEDADFFFPLFHGGPLPCYEFPSLYLSLVTNQTTYLLEINISSET